MDGYGDLVIILDDNQQQQNMGNQPCPQCKQSSAQNPAYGYYQIVSQGGNYYAHIQKQIQQSPKLKQILIQQLQMRCKMENKHLAKLYQFSITDLKYAYTVHFLYELINKSLRDRILQVRQTGLGFSERELFAILYGVQAALQELAKWKVKHCCINLDTILVRNNIYKLTDVSTTTYITSYDLVRKGSREQFLSQRLLNRLFHESLHPIYTYQDDLFSLGLIVLMLGTNSLPTDFYIWDEKGYASLNKKNIQKNFKLLKRRFSSKLVDKVRELLAEGCDGMESICYNGSNEIKIKDFEQDTTIKGCLKRGSRMSTGLSPDKSSSVLHL